MTCVSGPAAQSRGLPKALAVCFLCLAVAEVQEEMSTDSALERQRAAQSKAAQAAATLSDSWGCSEDLALRARCCSIL